MNSMASLRKGDWVRVMNAAGHNVDPPAQIVEVHARGASQESEGHRYLMLKQESCTGRVRLFDRCTCDGYTFEKIGADVWGEPWF